MQYLQIVEQQLRIYITTKKFIPSVRKNIWKMLEEVGSAAYQKYLS
jgi:hypothetical protein